MAGPWLAEEKREVMKHVSAGGVDEALSSVLSQLATKVGGTSVGVIPAKVSIDPCEDALRGFDGFLRGAFGRGAVRNHDDSGGVVLPGHAKGHFDVRAELQVPSLKLRVVESLEGFHVSGKAIDACALL